MPTPSLFKGVDFKETPSYLGERFQDYMIPNSFEPLVSLAGLGSFQDAIDEGRLIPCWEPFPKVSGDRPASATLEGNRQSPLPQRGTYTAGTIVNVFYWVGSTQYRITYQLTPLTEVSIQSIIDYDQLNAFQRLIAEVVPRLANLFPTDDDGNASAPGAGEATTEKERFVSRVIDWFQRNQIGNALGAWIEVASQETPIAGLGSPTLTGRTDTVFAGMDVTAPKAKVDFLGLLVSGVGIFTGNPVLIGGGLVLSFIKGRQK